MTEVSPKLKAIREEISKVVIGQDTVVWGVLASMLVGGHVILEGVPGVAKTLLIKTLAHTLDLDFQRIQFTPDLMPSDVSGNVVFEGTGKGFRFRPGPIFANIILADELNRTTPKTQSALLEAMEERQVSIEGETHPLPRPFLVAATQNPVEYEGTYPLPEAQLDRFLFKLVVNYPDAASEKSVLRMHHEGKDPHDLVSLGVKRVAKASDIAKAARQVVDTTVAEEVLDYIISLAAETRRSHSLALGVSPRGSAMLLHACKAWAYMSGREFVTPDDVKALVKSTWRHRILVRPEIELEGGTADSILDAVIQRVQVPR